MIAKFDLFCMIYYLLDSWYEHNTDEKLGNYLSDANPFVFDGEGSADPTVYDEFCKIIPQTIDIATSYDMAMNYIKGLNIGERFKSGNIIKEDEWLNAFSDYLKNK